ncbi:hypothetical protein ACLESD_47830 [Pyxidicoccus sp. 3LFB2]
MRVPPDNLPAPFHVSSLAARQLESGRPTRRAPMRGARPATPCPDARDSPWGRPSRPSGSFSSIPQHVPHPFHSIEERRVLFAPAESGG